MSLWTSYRALSPKTKLFFGLGLITYGAVGLWASPEVEKKMGMVPTKEEQEELDQKLRLNISTVEK